MRADLDDDASTCSQRVISNRIPNGVLLTVMTVPSWPKTLGTAAGIVPFMHDKSVWQIPDACISTFASSGLNSSSLTSSIVSGPLISLNTSAVEDFTAAIIAWERFFSF